MATPTFLDDVAAILHADPLSPLVKELAGLAWQGAEAGKGNRIKLFSHYIQTRGQPAVSFNNVTYDTLELLISLAHFKRARYG